MDIRVDRQKNRLYLKLSGFVSDMATFHQGSQAILDAARTLQPGFDIVTDISEFRTLPPEAAEGSRQNQAELAKLGVRRVVRVGGSALTKLQLARTSRELYSSLEAATVEEADRLLDTLPQSSTASTTAGAAGA